MNDRQIDKIVKQVAIQQKWRSVADYLSTACFTIVDAADNLTALKKWGLIEYSHIAAKIGSQSRVCFFVINQGGTALTSLASIGLFIASGDAVYRIYKCWIRYKEQTQGEEKEKAYKELRGAFLDLCTYGTEFLAVTTPLLLAVNPPVVVGLALIAKTTGLICILIK